MFAFERPLPPTPASRRLRVLIAVTALATVLAETVNFQYAGEAGFSLGVRTFWAIVRALGFLALMRAVRFGRPISRPFGLVLAVTTIFAVARLVQPRHGALLPRAPVIVSFVLLTTLCIAVVAYLYRSPAVGEHLSGRPMRRHYPGWVLTARIGALAYGALLMVPCLVAAGDVFWSGHGTPVTQVLVPAWFGLGIVVNVLVSFASYFVMFGRPWARTMLLLLSVFLLAVQPLLCAVTLGMDGVLRDGTPMVITVLVTLYALFRSRGVRTGYRTTREAPAAATG